MVLTEVQQQTEDAIRGKNWSELDNLLPGNEVEILGCNDFLNGSHPFLHCLFRNDPPLPTFAKIVDRVLHHIGVGPFMVERAPSNCLPLHYAAFYGHTMTPSMFATLLALFSAAGLTHEDCAGNTPLYYLQKYSNSPRKAALVELYQQALADHASFEAKYHPLVSVCLRL